MHKRTFTHADILPEAHIVFVDNAVKSVDIRLKQVGDSLVVHIELTTRPGETPRAKALRAKEAAAFYGRWLAAGTRLVHKP